MTIDYTYTNSGDGDAVASTVGIYLSTNDTITELDTLISTDSASALTSGESSSQSHTFTFDPSAASLNGTTYYLGVIADYADAIDESNQYNNDDSSNDNPIQITIDRPDLPDLVVTNTTPFAPREP